MVTRWMIAQAVLIVGLVSATTSCLAAEGQTTTKSATLSVAGEGYAVGDIVELAPAEQISVGDVMLFDIRRNNSSCGYFGPGEQLVKVLAGPGEFVLLTEHGIRIHDEEIPVSSPRFPLLLGATSYDAPSATPVAIPPDEYIVDQMTGMECTGRDADGIATGPALTRITVRREAVLGKVLRKIGHDAKIADEMEQPVY